MGKIAVELEEALAGRAAIDAPGESTGRLVARGIGWSVADVLCTYGPGDRPFEEQHSGVSIAVVVGGSFEYRSPLGREFMASGSFLLGNAGHCFECSHAHAAGDRCVAVSYSPDWFDELAADTGRPAGQRGFRASRLPPIRETSALVARASVGVSSGIDVSWEEFALQLGAKAIRLTGDVRHNRPRVPPGAASRVTQSVRRIERDAGTPVTLTQLAADAGLSPFHYLRTFQQVTGITPHQFILRVRLRDAALRLLRDTSRVIEIALDTGFGDISNFNRAFRGEFGVAPEAYRKGSANGNAWHERGLRSEMVGGRS